MVVASVQPSELGYEAAKQVRQNLDDNVRYIYFFEGHTDAADKVPQLLQWLLLADFLEKKNSIFKARNEVVVTHRDQIMKALTDICVHDKLNIFFPKESPELEYCIHNAASDRLAKLYLERRDGFFQE